MGRWQPLNRLLYGAFYRARLGLGRRAAPLGREAGARPAGGVLFVAWGRIGDAVLERPLLAGVRALFPGEPVTVVARAETAAVWRGLADATVPLGPAPFAELGALPRRWSAMVGDLHLFLGGTTVLAPWLASLEAPVRAAYAGYHVGPGLVPRRADPPGFHVVPPLPKDPGDLGGRHVLNDASHYAAALAALVGRPLPEGLVFRPSLPAPPAAAPALSRHGLAAGGFVTWQPVSNNPKKDWPLPRWRELVAAFPQVRFVALGSAREGARLGGGWPANVLDLCGRTSLPEAFSLIATARLHLGLDSGLTHVAAALGTRTVCVVQDANLGYFLPYPGGLGLEHVSAVHHPDYVACSGCFMTCEHEFVGRTRLAGALCLRTLPAAPVVAAVREALVETSGAAART